MYMVVMELFQVQFPDGFRKCLLFLFENLCFSLVFPDARIFICSCIPLYFISSLSDVVSLAVVNVFPM